MKRFSFSTFCIAALGLAASYAVSFEAQANEFKRIRDVNIACNNALRCDLYISNPRVTLYEFGFRRTSARQAPVSLVLSSREALRRGSDVVITIDGKEVFSKPVAAFGYRAATDEYIYNSQEDVLALLGEVQRGTDAQIRYATSNARSTAQYSLSGMVAGSLFMDDVQGRVGAASSMVALGKQNEKTDADTQTPASGRQIERWDALPEALGAYYGGENMMCDNAIDGSSHAPLGAFSIPIDGSLELLVLPCGQPAAYNVSYSIFESDGERVLPVSLPLVTDKGLGVTHYVSNVGWDEATQTLSSFHKGRGLGDCGTYAEWQFGDAGFTLLEAKQKLDCDGQYNEDLSDYERLWPLAD